MRRTYKPLFWRATRPVNSMDCMTEGRYCLKRIIIDIFILYFKKYFHSFIQSAVFSGRVARQNNGLYALRMIVKPAYRLLFTARASTDLMLNIHKYRQDLNLQYKTGLLRPRPYYTVCKRKRYRFVPDTATVHTTTLKTITENGSFRKRSPEWNDLKTVLFGNAVFLVWTAKTMLSENDDVTTTPPPGCRPLNREYPS